MNRTDFAQHLAPVAGAARPCGEFGLGYTWLDAAVMNVKSINMTATKRPARHLGKLTT